MKVKLLKKVRKQYNITYYANGCHLYGERYARPMMVLRYLGDALLYVDLTRMNYTKEQAYEYLRLRLISSILQNYSQHGVRRNAIKGYREEKMWYNK